MSDSSTTLFMPSSSPPGAHPFIYINSQGEESLGLSSDDITLSQERAMVAGYTHRLSSPSTDTSTWRSNDLTEVEYHTPTPVGTPYNSSNAGSPAPLPLSQNVFNRSASVISWAPSSRASSVGPIRTQRGIRADDANLDHLTQVNGRGSNFRFHSKTFFLTWSQIGDKPNSALEDKMASFGNDIKVCDFTFTLHNMLT
jgi:hypothetical protein